MRRPAPSRPPPTTDAAREARLAALAAPELGAVLRRPPAARAGHRRGPVPGVRRPQPRPVRQLVRVLPALRGRDAATRRPARSSPARSGPPPSGSTRWPRWASTSSTCRRSTRSARSTARAPTTRLDARARRPRLALGDRLQGRRPRRRPPRPRHARGLRRVRRRAPASSASRSPSTSRCRRRPTTRGSTTTPSGSPPAPTAPSPTPRTRRRSTRTSTRSTSTTTPTGIYREVLRVVRHWMAHGVRIFRVDNPHTKPVAFWEWLLGEVRRTDPDVLFLSEAFTRPAMMHALGAVGFHQTYTYFTWRTAQARDRATTSTSCRSETGHLMRPNFFVNTPDILHAYLQYGGPAAFKIRAVLAATGSPSWGVYAGYELYEHVAVQPGSEEYLDSEKYQIRIRDWEPARGRRAARSRRTSPCSTRSAARTRRSSCCATSRLHDSDDDERAACFSKRRPPSGRRRDRGGQPRPARHARDDGPPRPAGARARLATTRSPCTTRSPAQTGRWGAAQLRPARPRPRARHILTVRRPR